MGLSAVRRYAIISPSRPAQTTPKAQWDSPNARLDARSWRWTVERSKEHERDESHRRHPPLFCTMNQTDGPNPRRPAVPPEARAQGPTTTAHPAHICHLEIPTDWGRLHRRTLRTKTSRWASRVLQPPLRRLDWIGLSMWAKHALTISTPSSTEHLDGPGR